MKVFRYGIGELLITIALCAGFFFIGDLLTDIYQEGKRWFFGVALMCMMPVLVLSSLHMLFSRDALKLEPGRITYFTWLGQRRVTWRDFRGFSVQTYGRRSHLTIDFGKGLFGRCRIAEVLLEKRSGGIASIVAALEQYLQAEQARESGNYDDPTLAGGAEPFRRTRKASAQSAEHPQPAPPQMSGFGKKGL